MLLLLGLLHKQRTGKRLKVMNPQASSSVAIQTSRIAEFLATGENVPRMGSATTTTVPHRAFLCQDNQRWLAVGVVKDSQWQGLCKAIKAEDLLQDSRFATNPGRVQHRDELEQRLQETFQTKPARWWVIQLRKHKVPVSLFLDHDEIINHPQVRANRYFLNLKYPRIGVLPFGNLPFQYSKTPVQVHPGPWPGEHTSQVLEEGFGSDGTTQEGRGYFGPNTPLEKGILDGITVVDMTQGITGPYASLILWEEGFKRWKAEDLVAILDKFGSNSYAINDYQRLRDHPQIKALGLFQEVEDPKLGKVSYLLPPWTFYEVPKVEPKPYRLVDSH